MPSEARPPHSGRSLIWALIESGGLSVLSLAVLFVVARVLGPTDLGTAALAIGIVQMFAIVTDTLLHDAIVQRPDLSDEHLDTAFWTCLGLGVMFSAGGWLAAPLIGNLFGADGLAPLLAVAGLGLAFSGAGSVAIAVLRRKLLFKPLALRSLYGRLFGAIIAIGLALAGFGVWSLIAQYLLQTAMNTVFVWPSSPWRPRFRFNPNRLKELLSFGLLSVGTRIVWLSSARLFTILVGYFLGVTAVGYLNVAQRVVDTLHDMLAGAAYNLALPIFSRKQRDRLALSAAYTKATEFASLSMQPLFGGVAICATSIIALFLGDNWLPAAPVIQVLAVTAMFEFSLCFADAAITALGRPGYIFAASLAGFGFIVIVLVLFPPASVFMAAIQWGSRILVMASVLYALMHRMLGKSPLDHLGDLWAPTLGTAVMAAGLWEFRTHFLMEASPMEVLLLEIPIGALIYAAVIAIFKRDALSRLVFFIAEGIRSAKLSGSR